MDNKKNKPLYVFSTYLIAAVIAIVLLIGSVWYLLNYANQVEEKEKIEIAEYRLNELNSIYTNFLKAVKENRGYRLYGREHWKANYLTYRDSTSSLLNQYKLSNQFSKDSLQFAEFTQLIQKRIENLDEQLKSKSVNAYQFASEAELQRIDVQAATFIKTIRKHSALSDLKIMVGGYSFLVNPELWKRVAADAFALNADQAISRANELVTQ